MLVGIPRCGTADASSPNQRVPFKPGPKDLKRLTPLIVAATRFKQTARIDYVKAQLAHALPSGRVCLTAIDKALWDAQQSQFAWMVFFNSAVRVYAGRQGRFPLVGYYNPYSDTMLITAWAMDRKIPFIVDADLLMGDWIRDRSADLDAIPSWLRDPMHRPVALGLSVARTLLAFERVFADSDAQNWRTALAILQQPEALADLNYPGAALMMNSHLLNVLNFSYPEPKDRAFQTCRKLTLETLQTAGRDGLDALLRQADHTPSDMQDGLRRIPKPWFGGLKVCGALIDGEGCLVLLSPADQTSASLSLFFGVSNGQYRIKRIDYIDYRHFYNQFKYYRLQARQGGAQ
jgi:hypothetical protein